MQLPIFVSNTMKVVKSNTPEILTALGISGVITTSYLASKAGYDMARDEDADPHASLKEKVQRHWKLYIPTAISGSFTIGCIIGASKSTGKRTAAAVAAYSVTERAFSEYKEKVVEQIGAEKEQKLRDALAEKKIEERPVSKEVIVVGTGHVLCCELYTRRYFYSDMESLRKAQNDINALIINTSYVTLNEFYDLIDLNYTSESGHMGWDSDRMVELEFTSVLADNNEPCLAFNYNYIKPIR